MMPLNRLLLLTATLAAMLTAASGAAAGRHMALAQLDSLKESHRLVFMGGTPSRPADSTTVSADSIRRLVDMFYYDQFRHFQDPAAPYFLFMSKDAKLAMGVGGCVRMRGWFDWGNPVQANAFIPYTIPMTADPARRRAFGTTPAGTCLFFRVIGRDKRFGNYQLYIEANFNGYNSRGFNLKKAYAIINEWTIGYASSTFSDPAAEPPTVDAAGPDNKVSPTSVLVRWMHPFRERFTVALSAETPATAVGADGQSTRAVTNWLPDFAAFLQFDWARASHVRLAGILRTLSYRDLLAGRNVNKLGWGLQLSAVARPGSRLTLFGSFNGGMGYESLGSDLAVGNYDLVPLPGHDGSLYAPAAIGYCIGAQWNFTPAVYASASFSGSRYLPRAGVDPAEFRSGRVVMVNCFWDLTARIRAGAEFVTGSRKNFAGPARWANRVGLMAQFSF